MIISYNGGGFFRLQSGDTVITIDPTNNRQKSDLVLRTVAPFENGVPGADEIMYAGEYEAHGIECRGWQTIEVPRNKAIKTVYLLHFEDISFAVTGHIGAIPDHEILKELTEADILFLPVGEGFLNCEEAVKIVKQLEPAVVIPSYIKGKTTDQFLKALGQQTNSQEKFVFKRKDLAGKKAEVVVLEAK